MTKIYIYLNIYTVKSSKKYLKNLCCFSATNLILGSNTFTDFFYKFMQDNFEFFDYVFARVKSIYLTVEPSKMH